MDYPTTDTAPHVTCPQPAMSQTLPRKTIEPPPPSSLYGQPMSAATEPRGETVTTPTEPGYGHGV